MAKLFLVCEGDRQGLDERVLNTMIVERFDVRIEIRAACGHASLGSVAQYLRQRERARVVVIQDRDYTSRQQVDEAWMSGRDRLIWHRHEIENYLLDPRVIAKAFSRLRDSVRYWPESLPTTPKQTRALLEQIARPMTEHHAGWMTYTRLSQHRNSLADTRLHGPSRDKLVPTRRTDRKTWLNFLHRECDRMRAASQKLGSSEILSTAFVEQTYDANLAEITADNFWTSGQYIEDMGGHELMSELLDRMSESDMPISRNDLETELLAALDHIYLPGFYTNDDFDNLAERLKLAAQNA